MDLDQQPWLAVLATGQEDAYGYLSDFFEGVTFGLMLGGAYELSLIVTPQPGRFEAFVCHVDTPPDDMNMSRASLRVDEVKSLELDLATWDALPKVAAASLRMVRVGGGVEWSSEVADWYRRFRVPGTPGAGMASPGEESATYTPVEVPPAARKFLEQVDTVLDVLQTAREKRAHDLRRPATVISSDLTCPACHASMTAPARNCPECGRPMGSAYMTPGAVTEALVELPPGQADRFNSFQKLEVSTAIGELEAAFDIAERNRLRIYFRRPVPLGEHIEVAPIEGGAVAAAQRHALDMALSGHPDLSTVITLTADAARIPEPGPTPLPRGLFNESIQDNEEQTEAVRRITDMPQGSLMMLQGPPGTGKTTVIVEAVRQILDANPMARILISSHSN
ncbi:MAG: AAA domain-containing protein, partial [Candidatus Dormibacteria bacterium]